MWWCWLGSVGLVESVIESVEHACMGLFANGNVTGGKISMDRFHEEFPW